MSEHSGLYRLYFLKYFFVILYQFVLNSFPLQAHNMIPLTSLMVLLVYLGSGNTQCLSENDALSPSASDVNGFNSRDILYLGERAFSFDMLRSAAKGSSENIFLSPYSAYYALVLAYFGSASTTETKLKKTLHLDGQVTNDTC